MMKKINRREMVSALPALAVLGVAAKAEAQANETNGRGGSESTTTNPAVVHGTGMLAEARVFPLDDQPVRKMANGGESRDIAHGKLATGETVNLHQSMQVAGATPNPPHVIEHSEFVLVREGELEFEHELNGKMISERAGPGGVIYVAYGTRHTVKNVGKTPARYFVVAIGGDAK